MKADAQQGDEAQTLNPDLLRMLLGIDPEKRALRYVGMMLVSQLPDGRPAIVTFEPTGNVQWQSVGQASTSAPELRVTRIVPEPGASGTRQLNDGPPR